MDNFKIKIKGADWKIEFLTQTAYEKKHGENSHAMTEMEKKTISFIKGNCNVGIIRHELLHAFVTETHTESSSLTALQMEELCCATLQHQWSNIQMLVEEIVDQRLQK